MRLSLIPTSEGRVLYPFFSRLFDDLSLMAAAEAFFVALDGTLKKERLRLKELMEEFDCNGSGQLEVRELGGFVAAVMPSASQGEVSLLQVGGGGGREHAAC
jgi:hypothetical protein